MLRAPNHAETAPLTRLRSALLLALLLGCRAASETFAPAAPVDESTVIVSNGAEPKSIDPGLADESAGIELAHNCFEGLTAYAARTLAPEPGMAERWELSPDGLTYTFHLRNAVWSDGRPVTAHDFVYAWRRALSPELASQYAYQLWYLRGAQAFNEGREKEPSTVGVRAIDDRTLEVRLERPTPFFLFLTSFVTYAPVPRQAIEAHGRLWTRPGKIVVNGAYLLTDARLQDSMTLEKNPRYWNAADVRIGRVVALTNDSDHSVMSLYRTGQVHTTSPNSPPPLAAVPSLRKFRDYSEHPFLSIYYYWFNTRKPPFDDVRVRRALAKAIDKRRIVETVLQGLNEPTWGMVPDLFRDVTGYRPPVTEADRHDPAEARKLLAEAGFPDGKGFPSTELMFNSGGDGHRLVGEAVQAMWKRELGLEVSLVNLEWKVMLSEMISGNHQIARSGWQADYPEPSTFLTVFLGDGGQNMSGWKSAEYDRTLTEALSEPDPTRRNALYARCERILLDAMPVIPVYTYSKSTLNHPRLGGLDDNPMDLHLYKHLFWKPIPAGGAR